MKKILVLGIGPSQVDLIMAAKEMGMEVYACANNSSGPGRNLVDGFCQADIRDVSAVENYAREIHADFIYSMGLEMAIPIIASVSERLGLPVFCNLESLSKLENKARWREALGDLEGNLRYRSGRSLEDFESWSIYPAILKPVDGSGQRGVHKVNSFSDVQANFDLSLNYSRSQELIIEEFAEGPEISVNSFMYDGNLTIAVISDRISYSEYPGGIVKEHIIPSSVINKESEAAIYRMVEQINQKMGFINGHVYFQLKVHNGEPKLIEFTPRFDGCHMWRLVDSATGLDLRKVSLQVLAYGKSELLERFQVEPVEGRFILQFLSDQPGTIIDRSHYVVPEKFIFLEWYYSDGHKVKTVTSYMEKIGYLIRQDH